MTILKIMDSRLDPEETGERIFIVHGRDETVPKKMITVLKEHGLVPIMLYRQTSSGRNIIDNLEYHTDAKAALVFYTPDDLGKFVTDKDLKPRARQNVIFEHGMLISKLGREKTIMIVDGDPELPTDISGITYIHTSLNAWKQKVIEELLVLGILKEEDLVRVAKIRKRKNAKSKK